MRSLSVLALLFFATLGHAVVGPGVVTGNTAVHDPTMCKDNSGKYFVFCASIFEVILFSKEQALKLTSSYWGGSRD
jgi:arabinan endo-1,5-alpha-L-arabinosidase